MAALTPVLAPGSPEYTTAMPPALRFGLPAKTTLPFVLVPAAVPSPALNLRAGVVVLTEVFVVTTFCEIVKSPVRVITETVPVASMPL